MRRQASRYTRPHKQIVRVPGSDIVSFPIINAEAGFSVISGYNNCSDARTFLAGQ